MKKVLCLAVLLTSALWANEAADRAAIEATVSALNSSPTRPGLFTAGFSNAAELENFKKKFAPAPASVETPAGTVVISREPMGEATWIPGVAQTALVNPPRFVMGSITFVNSKTANVVAIYKTQSQRQSVLFVLKRQRADWRIASFRILSDVRN